MMVLPRLFTVAVVFSGLLGIPAEAEDQIAFDQQVRPILSNHCWSCHGPDEASRRGDLRLDLADIATARGESGAAAVVPGDADKSELISRIESHDADVRMPPDAAKKPLSDEQKQTLREWINQGAKFSTHWAFRVPERPELPQFRRSEWARNEIDLFILKTLEDEQLQPVKEASPAVWLRRVTLDLTGLPPSLDELNDFETQLASSQLASSQKGTDAIYSGVVDRLLKSPRYGERMAMHWLDAARYADTNGYNNDETRTMWPWRDWVINAFTSGMPYDQFLTEQLAGDLLPEATINQRVATGFNRNHVLTTEGGIIEEEYHVEYVADRVHTTATVFLAMSLQCARCHDHKFDPISQRDYYQFASFFNNIPDRVVSYNKDRMAEPLLKVPSPEQTAELQRIEARAAEIETLLQARFSEADADLSAWESTLTADQITNAKPVGLQAHFAFDETDGNSARDLISEDKPGKIVGTAIRAAGQFGQSLKFDGSNYVDAGQVGTFESSDKFSVAARIQLASGDASTVLSRMDEASAFRGYDLILEGGKVAAHFVHSWPDRGFKVVSNDPISLNEWHHIAVTYDGSLHASGVKMYVDGVAQEFDKTTDNELSGTLKTEKSFHIGRREKSASFKGLIDDVQLYAAELTADEVARLSKGELIGHLAEIFATPAGERSEVQRTQLRQYFVDHVDPKSKQLKAERDELPGLRDEVEKAIPATMVMSEPSTARPAFILNRGQYNQRGEQVESEFPSALSTGVSVSGLNPPGMRTRLDLARWLTDPQHPLTARVAVNRFWEMLFGTGLVETSEDFGMQGAFPSHPELLDWLATELVRQKWDQRVILKQLVLSATYRQESGVTPKMLERDPKNRLLARGTRYRLPAETVRDSALFVSGLFKEHIGGPSVKPYQPEGLWEDVSVERRDKYVPDVGDGLYRRSMYTFWKRTCPPPGMSTFDAPDREFCVVRRARTNTPLQALVLLNDPTYVEAARKLAEHCLLAADNNKARINHAFRRVLCRLPDESEQATLMSVIADAAMEYGASPEAAEELLSVGNSPREPGLNSSELAAWTVAMSVLLNLDETISRL